MGKLTAAGLPARAPSGAAFLLRGPPVPGRQADLGFLPEILIHGEHHTTADSIM